MKCIEKLHFSDFVTWIFKSQCWDFQFWGCWHVLVSLNHWKVGGQMGVCNRMTVSPYWVILKAHVATSLNKLDSESQRGKSSSDSLVVLKVKLPACTVEILYYCKLHRSLHLKVVVLEAQVIKWSFILLHNFRYKAFHFLIFCKWFIWIHRVFWFYNIKSSRKKDERGLKFLLKDLLIRMFVIVV